MAEGTPTLLVAATTQGAGQTTTTGSFTPTANAVIFVHFHGVNGTAPSVPTISDSVGLTWTLVTSTGGTFNGTNRSLVVWAVAPASPSAMTVQVDWGASIASSCCAPFEITGVDTTTPILAGSTATGTGTSTTPASGAVPAITAGNTQVLFVNSRSTGGTTRESATWTELYDANSAANCLIACYYTTAGDTTPTATTASSSAWKASAAEIAAAAVSGGGFQAAWAKGSNVIL